MLSMYRFKVEVWEAWINKFAKIFSIDLAINWAQSHLAEIAFKTSYKHLKAKYAYFLSIFFRNIKESPNLAGLMTLNNLKVRIGESIAHNRKKITNDVKTCLSLSCLSKIIIFVQK